MSKQILIKVIQISLLTLAPLALLRTMISHESSPRPSGEAPTYTPEKSYFRKRHYHLIPHSHDDPGWVFTFTGAHVKFEKQMDNVIFNQMQGYQPFTFTFSDIIFLPGYEKMNQGAIDEIKDLVQKKKILIVNCGMSMPDQALTHYDDLINNFEYGREFCLERLGVLPKVGWSIDPFGESAYISRLFAEMGYSAQVINRIPFYEKADFKRKKNMIFNWKGRYDEDSLPTYLTHMHYFNPPPSMYPRPVTQMLNVSYDLMERVLTMMMYSETSAADYNGGESVFLMGDDFTFIHEDEFPTFFGVYIILKSNSKAVFQGSTSNFSSFEEYLSSQKKQNLPLPTYGPNKDFMPLVESLLHLGDTVWTGFYFIRPTFKLIAKDFGRFYRGMVEQLAFGQLTNEIGDILPSISESLMNSRITQGLMTHHDAVTGTANMYVLHDYEKTVNDSIAEMTGSLAGLISSQESRYQLGETLKIGKEEQRVDILASNGATRSKRRFRIRIDEGCPENGGFWVTEGNPSTGASAVVVQDRVIGCELSYTDKKAFAPWERRVYSVGLQNESNSSGQLIKYSKIAIEFGDSVELQGKNGRVKILVNDTSISVEEMKEGNQLVKWSINLWKYGESLSNLHKNIRNRIGVYIMRTLQDHPDPIHFSTAKLIRTGNNTVVTLQMSTYPYMALHLIHEPESAREFRVRFTVKELYQPGLRDFVLRLSFPGVPSSSEYSKVFYTDSNGQDVMRRVHEVDKQIEYSYRPFASFISIPARVEGKYRAVSIVSDRPSGGTTPAPGVIEIGVARNNVGKDNYGVHEGCFDYNPVHSEFTIVWEERTHEKPEEAVPGNTVRRAQLEVDTSLLLAKLSKPDSGLVRKGVQSDEESNSLLTGVKGQCGSPSDIGSLIRISLDSRSQGIAVKVYNLNEFCTVKISNISEFIRMRVGLSPAKTLTVEERSIDFNQAVKSTAEDDATLLISPALRQIALKESSTANEIILKPLKYKAFKVRAV